MSHAVSFDGWAGAMTEREEAEQVPRRRASDQQSAWRNPGVWVSICGLLLTVAIFYGGRISSQLDALLVASATNSERQAALTDRVAKIEHRLELADGERRIDAVTQAQADSSIRDRLAKIEAEIAKH